MTPHQIAQEPKLHTCGNFRNSTRRSETGTVLWRASDFSAGARPGIIGIRIHTCGSEERRKKLLVYPPKLCGRQDKKVRSDCQTLHAQQYLPYPVPEVLQRHE